MPTTDKLDMHVTPFNGVSQVYVLFPFLNLVSSYFLLLSCRRAERSSAFVEKFLSYFHYSKFSFAWKRKLYSRIEYRVGEFNTCRKMMKPKLQYCLVMNFTKEALSQGSYT